MATRESRSLHPRFDRFGQFLEREVGEAHRHVQLAAQRGGERHVLVRQVQAEVRRIEHRRQELIRQPIEHPRAADESLADDAPQHERVDAAFDSHREHFGKRGLDRIARAVVHELGHGCDADRADVRRLIADVAQQCLVSL